MAVLRDEQQIAIGSDGDHCNGAGVADGFAVRDDAALHFNLVQADVEEAAAVRRFGGDEARVGHGWDCGFWNSGCRLGWDYRRLRPHTVAPRLVSHSGNRT